jgi:hypothetical protein
MGGVAKPATAPGAVAELVPLPVPSPERGGAGGDGEVVSGDGTGWRGRYHRISSSKQKSARLPIG